MKKLLLFLTSFLSILCMEFEPDEKKARPRDEHQSLLDQSFTSEVKRRKESEKKPPTPLHNLLFHWDPASKKENGKTRQPKDSAKRPQSVSPDTFDPMPPHEPFFLDRKEFSDKTAYSLLQPVHEEENLFANQPAIPKSPAPRDRPSQPAEHFPSESVSVSRPHSPIDLFSALRTSHLSAEGASQPKKTGLSKGNLTLHLDQRQSGRLNTTDAWEKIQHVKKIDGVYKCPYVGGCPHTTKVKRDLARHMLRHTGETPFKCPGCDIYSSDPKIKHAKGHEKRTFQW